jgi:L-lactate dehydrogenase complex protein LldE
MNKGMPVRGPGLRVGLFVTCLVDLIRPSVGFAAAKLLQDAGCIVEVPLQTCCGQPAYNSGDRATARQIAEQVITSFEPYHYVVAPSGSCAGMLKTHYPDLFAGDAAWAPRAQRFCMKSYELVSFLVDVLRISKVDAAFDGTVTYHDSCSGLRELGIKAQPRTLLAGVEGLALKEMQKAEHIAATGAGTLLAGDLGCLLNMAGRLQRLGKPVQARHVAEVLAGTLDTPAIGERS